MREDIITKQKTPISPGERKASRAVLFFEDVIKVPLFGCQHCGECILSSTAFVCSQRCPKRLRNGPCGGTRPGGMCEVYPERRCVWVKIHKRSKALGRVSMLFKMNKIHNWTLEGTSSWVNVIKKRIDPAIIFPPKSNNKLPEGTSHDA